MRRKKMKQAEADREERLARLEEWISRLPDGYMIQLEQAYGFTTVCVRSGMNVTCVTEMKGSPFEVTYAAVHKWLCAHQFTTDLL